jgi:hypothetical protein
LLVEFRGDTRAACRVAQIDAGRAQDCIGDDPFRLVRRCAFRALFSPATKFLTHIISLVN